jgi:hypothetical protein
MNGDINIPDKWIKVFDTVWSLDEVVLMDDWSQMCKGGNSSRLVEGYS